MKKIVRQQNYLRELIDTQANRFLSYQALKCLLKSAIEPLLDAPESGVVLYRIQSDLGLKGILRRLEFSEEINSHNFSDDSGNLKEKVWANTEFLCVMTHRYVSIIIWDTNTGDKNTVRYYSLYNSKLQNEPLDIIKRNSNIDISPYQEKYNPDRRDNILLNASIRRLLDNMDEASYDAVLGFAEKSVEDTSYDSRQSRIAAHEIRNQLSICDLYTEIIRKSSDNDGVQNAVKIINKALRMANVSLMDLKSNGRGKLEEVSLKELVDSAVDLAGVFLEGKDITFEVKNNADIKVSADSDKLTAVIINLVKNAVEAFADSNQNGKYIRIETDEEDEFALISVSNNAPGIVDSEKLFNEGFTTKSTGSGLGLWISKKSVEEMNGELELARSGEDYTEFVIRLEVK